MQKIRRLYMNASVIRPILAIFLLWAGMFVCLLPGEVYAGLNSHDAPMKSSPHEVRAFVSDYAGSDCVETDDESVPTYCKTDGKTVVLSDLIKIVGIANEAIPRFHEFVPFRSDVPIVAIFPLIRNIRIFLLDCSFLK